MTVRLRSDRHPLFGPGFVLLVFDRPITAARLDVSILNTVTGLYLGPSDPGRTNWVKQGTTFFPAIRAGGPGSTIFRIGPEVTTYIQEGTFVEIASADGSVHEEFSWEGVLLRGSPAGTENWASRPEALELSPDAAVGGHSSQDTPAVADLERAPRGDEQAAIRRKQQNEDRTRDEQKATTDLEVQQRADETEARRTEPAASGRVQQGDIHRWELPPSQDEGLANPGDTRSALLKRPHIGSTRESASPAAEPQVSLNLGWKERLRSAWDRRTLFDSFILLFALNCVLPMPPPNQSVYFGEGLLGLAGAGFVSSIVVLISVVLLGRGGGLTWALRITIALAYSAASLLGLASVPVLEQLGLDSYTARYAGQVDFAFIFGCMGAGAVMWPIARSQTVAIALTCTVILLAARYAIYQFFPATLLVVLPLPVVLIGALTATARERVSAGLDAAVVAGAWLTPIVLLMALPLTARVMPDVVLALFKYVDPLAFMGLALPTAFAWPAIKLARPGIDWSVLSRPVIPNWYLMSGIGVLASVLVISLASNILYRSTNIYHCAILAKIDACSAVIDSPNASARDRLTALEKRSEFYSRESKWDQAIADQTRLIELDPQNPERYTTRADFWSQADILDQAVADLDAALSLQPNNAKTRIARFETWKKFGNDRQAMAELNDLIRLEPTADNFIRRAEYNTQNFAAAISDYGTAIRMDPKNTDNLRARANRFENKGDVRAAEADYMSIKDVYDAEIANSPSPSTFRKRAEIWERLKNYAKAVEDYTAAIQLEPADGQYYFWQASTFELRYGALEKIARNPAQLMRALDELVSKEPTRADNYRIRAEARNENQVDSKLSDYDQAIRLRPDDVNLRLARAALLERKGNFSAAIADYDKAVRADPKSASALYRRGLAKSSNGDRTGTADIAAAKAIDPDIGR